MSVPVAEPSNPLLDAYRHHPGLGGVDELVVGEAIQPHAQQLADTIDTLGLPQLLTARAEAARQVADEGISYGDRRRPWRVDPLPLPLAASDWTSLERGLAQRARLLDAVLIDLYGPRTLLQQGILPAAAILTHPGFARAADGTIYSGQPQLLTTATDLGRGPDGSWQVISDRLGAPAGAGYAMATRRIVSKVMAGLHRASDLARLRGYFVSMTGALLDAAGAAEVPRVVLLSPGADSRSGYDQGFLAALLGFPLAEADDLVIRHGRVWLRAGDELEPVDVILRRVSDDQADPLELRSSSEVGLPGLIEANRNRTVRVANPIGVEVLDNPALLAYLPELCTALLGEQPLLNSPDTWWCGEASSASHVLAHLDELVIKPVTRSGAAPVRYGWRLSAAERDELRARITAEPWAWCGQVLIELSTAPVVTTDGLEPRRFLLRSFGVATADGYQFLPGGLGRVAANASDLTVSSDLGALAKDVWVPSSVAEVAADERRPRLTIARESAVPPRVARALMTIGRTAERAESTARLLKVADDLTEDFGSRPGSAGAAATATLLDAVVRITGVRRPSDESGVDYLTRVSLDETAVGGVHHSVRRLIGEALGVRDLMSVDLWSVFGRLEQTLAEPPNNGEQLQPLLADVLESLLAYAGIMAQSMVRDSSWAFLDAGGRLERAEHTVKLLANSLIGLPELAAPTAELVADAVLRAGESIITHRRRAAAGTGPATGVESAVQLLLHDPSNPRSVGYQLAALAADLRLAGDGQLAEQTLAIAHRLAEGGELSELLRELGEALDALGRRIAARHFVRQATRHAAEASWTHPALGRGTR